jgi:hypothetical protein
VSESSTAHVTSNSHEHIWQIRAHKPLVSGVTRSMTLNPLHAEWAHTGGARSRNTTQFILEGRVCKGMRWESAHAQRRARGSYPPLGAFQRGCFGIEIRAIGGMNGTRAIRCNAERHDLELVYQKRMGTGFESAGQAPSISAGYIRAI